MRSFFLFLHKYRAFLVFILLQSAAAFLIIKNSNYNRVTFLNSTNTVIGSLLESSNYVKDIIKLIETNEKIIRENTLLRAKYFSLLQKMDRNSKIDTLNNFRFIHSKIVKNSVFLLNNTITINSGNKQGVQPGMGVISNQGIVGKVKRVGTNYSTIVSLLDIDVKVSAEIKNKINLCTVQWDGRFSDVAKVLYVPRHYKLAIGDSVVTSGYNAVYPPGISIGVISNISLPNNATFYDIEIKLVNDFTKLSLVEIIINKDLPQLDSLLTIKE